jgi:hypothetical protein
MHRQDDQFVSTWNCQQCATPEGMWESEVKVIRRLNLTYFVNRQLYASSDNDAQNICTGGVYMADGGSITA